MIYSAKLFVPLPLLLMLPFLSSCGKVWQVLGPTDSPDLSLSDITELSVEYWIYVLEEPRPLRRTVVISEGAVLSELKDAFSVEEIKGLSFGAGRRVVASNSQNEVWHGDIIFEDVIYLTFSSDSWRSYKVKLRGVTFYDHIRTACAVNEKNEYPDVTPEHIKIRSNLLWDYPRLQSLR